MPTFPKDTTKHVNKRFEELTFTGLKDHKNTNTDKPMSHEKIFLNFKSCLRYIEVKQINIKLFLICLL